jgi:branched-chain amino acid transport system substrate-binding protein
MDIEIRAILLVLCAGFLVACSSDSPETPSTQDHQQRTSLFQADTSEDMATYPYQTIYPGDTIDTDSLVIGLDAAMTGDFAKSGVSIWRGMVLAVDEMNKNGGLLGRKLQILVKDHRANPKRGFQHIEEFAKRENLLAVMGGMHTPVLLNELSAIHEKNVISLVPWAAGTPIVDNGYEPNNVFRLSVRDEHAGPFLVKKLTEAGYDNPALLLEKTGWGRSNRKALTEALEHRGLSPASISFFNWTKKSFDAEIRQARTGGADSIIFVGNAPEGITLVKSMARQKDSERLPILSHWGITGGQFFEKTQSVLPKVTLRVLQTRSFLDPANPDYAQFERQQYCKKFACPNSAGSNIFAPVGTAHAHDLVHLLGNAVRNTKSSKPSRLRESLETLGSWKGIVRDYDRPFTAKDHEALSMEDYRIARYDSTGTLVLSDLK